PSLETRSAARSSLSDETLSRKSRSCGSYPALAELRQRSDQGAGVGAEPPERNGRKSPDVREPASCCGTPGHTGVEVVVFVGRPFIPTASMHAAVAAREGSSPPRRCAV